MNLKPHNIIQNICVICVTMSMCISASAMLYLSTARVNYITLHYTLPAKNMEYFSFQRFLYFCGVCKVFIYVIYIPTKR